MLCIGSCLIEQLIDIGQAIQCFLRPFCHQLLAIFCLFQHILDQLLDGIIRLLAPHRLNHLYETIQLCHTFTDARNRPCYAQCIVKAHILCVRVLLHPIDRRCSDATLWHVNDSP